MPQKIRVMLVDDSAVIRGMYDRTLSADGAFEVVATAANGQIAINILAKTPVDVIVLDVEMPVMDGITALPELLKLAPKTRVIMASTLTQRNAEISVRAMQLGASDYIPKPSSKEPTEVAEFYRSLIAKVKALAPHVRYESATNAAGVSTASPSHAHASAPSEASVAPSRLYEPLPTLKTPVRMLSQPPLGVQALAIASSTGGPQALLQVFREFSGRTLRVPIFITQHMPPNFTAILADHIAKASGQDCHEGKDGELVQAGKIYLAPGDYHMLVVKDGGQLRIRLNQEPAENFCRPSADPMFRSIAKVYGDKVLGAVLTGLGADGARGAYELVSAGGVVVSQDEATSVVYGMPKAVADAKLTSAVLPITQVAPFLIKAVC